jgi:hypothetical protein
MALSSVFFYSLRRLFLSCHGQRFVLEETGRSADLRVGERWVDCPTPETGNGYMNHSIR